MLNKSNTSNTPAFRVPEPGRSGEGEFHNPERSDNENNSNMEIPGDVYPLLEKFLLENVIEFHCLSAVIGPQDGKLRK